MNNPNLIIRKLLAQWGAIVLSGFLVISSLSGAFAQEQSSGEADPRPYPYVSGERSMLILASLRAYGFGNVQELPQVSPDRIAYALNNKTALVVFGIDHQAAAFGTSNRPDANVIWYFRDDGVLFLNDGPTEVLRASWSIVDDRILHVMHRSKELDGSTRVVIRAYPLDGFFESILDAGDEDACSIGDKTTEHVNYASETITGSSLEQVCPSSPQATGTGKNTSYPTMDGIAAELIVEEFEKRTSDPYRLRPISPETVVEKLVGKTIRSAITDSTYEVKDNVAIHKTTKRIPLIIYLRSDGEFLLSIGPGKITRGDWMIAGDTVMIMRPKIPDSDGIINVETWMNSLSSFVANIQDAEEGDYCEMETGTTSAFVYRTGSFSSRRLVATCGRRKRR